MNKMDWKPGWRVGRGGQRRLWLLTLGLVLAINPGGSRVLAGQDINNKTPHLPQSMNPMPSAIDQQKMQEHAGGKKNFEAVNAERKKEIGEESAILLRLAVDLKTEVDKTDKDTLSLKVIRKAEAIEKLAHDVREKMKLSIGSN